MAAATEGDPKLADAEEQDDEKIEESEEFQQKILEAGRCLQCFNGLLLIVGAGLTAFSFVGAEQLASVSALPFLSWVPYAVSGTGFALVGWTAVGCLGGLLKQSGTKLLLLYYTCLVFATLALVIFGGFCLILTDTAVATIENNWDEFVAGLEPSQREGIDEETVLQNLQLYMYGTGAVAFLLVGLLMAAMGSIVRLVTPVQANSMLLQATTIALLPLGVGLIAAGLYVADTAATVEAPIAAFSIFVMGIIVIMVTTVGCVGTALHSRGIILIFMWMIAVLSILFVAFGITSLVQADTVRDAVVERWDSIRRVLPPTFSGKYDRAQFEAFVTNNLRVIGFMSLCSGVILAVMWNASRKLRFELKRQTHIDEEMDELYEKLTSTFRSIRDAIERLKDAKRVVIGEGVSKPEVDQHVQRMVVEETRRHARLLAAIEEDNEADEDMAQELLDADPPASGGESGSLFNLRCAVYRRIRVSAAKKAIEDELDDKEREANMLAGLQGARNIGRGEEEKAAKSAEAAGGDAGAAGSKSRMRQQDLADLSIPRRKIVRQLNPLQNFWKQRWTKGTTRSRRLIKCCCFCIACVALLIMTMAVLSLYFSTSCSNIGDYAATTSYDSESPLDQSGSASSATSQSSSSVTVGDVVSGSGLGSIVKMETDSTRGTLQVSLDSEAEAGSGTTLLVEKTAFRQAFASTDFPNLEIDESGAVVANVPQKIPTKVFGFDVSCQNTNMDLSLPASAAGTVDDMVVNMTATGDYAGIELDWSDTPSVNRPRFHNLTMSTTGGPISLNGVGVGGIGMTAQSNLGEVTLEGVDGHCDATLLGTGMGGVSLNTTKGTISIDGSSFLDCDVSAAGDAALVSVTRTTVRNSQGGGLLTLQGNRGLIDVSNSAVEVLDVKGESGSVLVSTLNVTEGFRVATLSGSVTIEDLRLATRAVLQVDTGEGLVKVHARQFSGILSIVTGGSVSCQGDGFDSDAEDPCPIEEGRSDGLKVVEEVAVNCATAGPDGSNDCPYRGEMTITSATGSVTVIVDAEGASSEDDAN